jgi:hypothetical protein
MLSLACLAQAPADFEARLELHRNGKLMGETTFSFSSGDGQWLMQTQTKGTKGLARFVGLDESSYSKGDWVDSHPRPQAFERNVKAIVRMNWQATFDWDQGVVETVHPDGESRLELEPGVVDETAIGLVVRAGLGRGEEEWFLKVVDEDEIEDQHFRRVGVERMQTALGCVTVHDVMKVRAETSKRYTHTYYAEEFDFVPVFMKHGKKGDDHMESHIVSLSIAGQPARTLPDCS